MAAIKERPRPSDSTKASTTESASTSPPWTTPSPSLPRTPVRSLASPTSQRSASTRRKGGTPARGQTPATWLGGPETHKCAQKPPRASSHHKQRCQSANRPRVGDPTRRIATARRAAAATKTVPYGRRRTPERARLWKVACITRYSTAFRSTLMRMIDSLPTLIGPERRPFHSAAQGGPFVPSLRLEITPEWVLAPHARLTRDRGAREGTTTTRE